MFLILTLLLFFNAVSSQTFSFHQDPYLLTQYFTYKPVSSMTSPISTYSGLMFLKPTDSACSNQYMINTSEPFSLQMWVHVFQISDTHNQTLACQLYYPGNQQVIEKFCLIVESATGNIIMRYEDQDIITNTKVQGGWNYLVVNVYPISGIYEMLHISESACSQIKSETGTFPISAEQQQVIPPIAFCIGNSLERDLLSNRLLIKNQSFEGLFAYLELSSIPLTSQVLSEKIACNEECFGTCQMCNSTGKTCFQQTQNSTALHYDFKKKDTNYQWSGIEPPKTINGSNSIGPSFKLSKDYFAQTPYYVAGQGLKFHNSSKLCSDQSPLISSLNSYTFSLWFNLDSPVPISNLLQLLDQPSQKPLFSLSTSGSQFLQVTFPMDNQQTTLTFDQCPLFLSSWTHLTLTRKPSSQFCIHLITQQTSCTHCLTFIDISTSTFLSLNQVLCIGDGFSGKVAEVNVYPMPISEGEASRQVRTTDCQGSCQVCSWEDKQCIGSCQDNEYGQSCLPCDSHCGSCFGPRSSQCFSCIDDLTMLTAQQNETQNDTNSTAVALKHKYDYKYTLCNYCGDGFVLNSNDLEQCDDGNVLDNDGCNSTCQIEPHYGCVPANTNELGPSICKKTCIQGWNVRPPAGSTAYLAYKECDDGNLIEDDGCSSMCTINTGWACTGGNLTHPDTCTEICGDGLDYGNYQCDDGNLLDGDGCSSLCTIESGWNCTLGNISFPDICRELSCGQNAFDVGARGCADHNISPNDGCNGRCEVERGWECKGGDPGAVDQCNEVCGDGFNMKQYQCDDGNIDYPLSLYSQNPDGCSAGSCSIRQGFTCSGSDLYQRDTCSEICGDGRRYGTTRYWYLQNANQCDDGNQRPGDGCSDHCQIESGWECSGGGSNTPDVCKEVCGDGRRFSDFDPGACDDGNNSDGDGCSSDCRVEPGYKCLGGTPNTPDRCFDPCGDGRSSGYHACDDGNNINGDGCSKTCQLEPGFQCSGGGPYTPDQCTEICGDGSNMGQHQCDDGNLYNGDGCSSRCQIEPGWQCNTTQGSGRAQCYEVCGDGMNFGSHQCDDGNIINGDGCDSKCQIESCWICDSKSNNPSSNCSIDPQKILKVLSFEQDQNQILVTFSQNVQSYSTDNLKELVTIYLEGPFPESYYSDISFSFSQPNQNQLEVQIRNQSSVKLFNDESLNICLQDFKHQTCNLTLQPTCHTFYLHYQQTITHNYQSLIRILLYVLCAKLLLSLMLIPFSSNSLIIILQEISIMQYLYYLSASKLYIPDCLQQWLQNFKWSVIQEEFITSYLFSKDTYLISNPMKLTDRIFDQRYQSIGIDSLFVAENVLDLLALAILVVVTILTLMSIVKILIPKFENSINKWAITFLEAMACLTFMKLSLTALLDLQFSQVNDLRFLMGLLLSTYLLLLLTYLSFQFIKLKMLPWHTFLLIDLLTKLIFVLILLITSRSFQLYAFLSAITISSSLQQLFLNLSILDRIQLLLLQSCLLYILITMNINSFAPHFTYDLELWEDQCTNNIVQYVMIAVYGGTTIMWLINASMTVWNKVDCKRTKSDDQNEKKSDSVKSQREEEQNHQKVEGDSIQTECIEESIVDSSLRAEVEVISPQNVVPEVDQTFNKQ